MVWLGPCLSTEEVGKSAYKMVASKRRFYSKSYYKGLALEPRFKEVAKIFTQLRGERLLDVGCGDGDITLLLKGKMGAKEAYGLELAQEAVTVAKQKGIMCYQLDIDETDFPFNDEFFLMLSIVGK
jgi:cyclopropane fatty-acyl-phospholipid synthase-like methyltransferase